MTDRQKEKQYRRLQDVSPHRWREVKATLTRRATERLDAALIRDERGVPKLVGGRTKKGAHSEVVLQMNALDYYIVETIKKLYEFKWEWREDLDIEQQCLVILDNLISKQAKKFQRQTMKQVDLDVDNLKEEEEPLDEEEEKPQWYEEAKQQMQDSPELVELMDAIDQYDTPRERCKRLGIDGRQYENLRKKCGRRLNKILIK